MSITVTVDDVRELVEVMLEEVVVQTVTHGSNRVSDCDLDKVVVVTRQVKGDDSIPNLKWSK